MKKRWKALALAAGMSLSILVGCSAKAEGFLLDAFTDGSIDGAYDSANFYRNDLTVFGGDADVIWVSKEEGGEEYGGWFYMYTSGNDGVYMQEYDTHKAAVTCLRSRDLNDWELCGTDGVRNEGFSAYIENDEWVQSFVWAPEVTYNPCTCSGDCAKPLEHNKYFMYFNARAFWKTGSATPTYNADDMGLDGSDLLTCVDGETQWSDRFCGAVLMSDTPVGPFKLANGERYYGQENAKNLNGWTMKKMSPQLNFTKQIQIPVDDPTAIDGQKIKERFTREDYTPSDKDDNGYYDLEELGLTFSMIDLSPMWVDGELYLYFARHMDNDDVNNDSTNKFHHDHNCYWVVKMKDMITPDWTTLTNLTNPNWQMVSPTENSKVYTWDESLYERKGHFYKLNDQQTDYDAQTYVDALTGETVSAENNKYMWEAINEGGQAIAHTNEKGKTRYYLCTAQRGVSDPLYSVTQAVSDSPLGPYYKIPHDEGGVAYGRSLTNDFASGVGHHAFIEVEGELYCSSYVHADPYIGGKIGDDGRIYVVDKLSFVETEKHGTLLYGNGPTQALQPKVTVASGKRNVALNAKVEVKGGDKKTAKYLNDGNFVVYEYYKDWEYQADGATTITLKWDEPVTISAVMVYNSYDYEYAFSQVDFINFKLAEKPNWYTGKKWKKAYIEDIPFSEDHYNVEGKYMRAGGSALASFDEIKVTSITIKISQKLSNANKEIRISDIVVLGR
ncbi:MAG: hypothetical protein IJX49_02180 [Clostridia bacterium]|nr:hypothetical protein [Clostridia bacterium]